MIDSTAKTMVRRKVTPIYMNIITQGLCMALVTKEKAMIEQPARIQFTTDAAVHPDGDIMKPIYGHTQDPRLNPKVNMKIMMQMQVNSKI